MTKKDIVIVANYHEQTPLTVEELCEVCNIKMETVQTLVEYAIVQPQNDATGQWMFNIENLQRIKIALRLQQDLEVNAAGAALILEMLDEMKALRNQVAIMEKHFFNL